MRRGGLDTHRRHQRKIVFGYGICRFPKTMSGHALPHGTWTVWRVGVVACHPARVCSMTAYPPGVVTWNVKAPPESVVVLCVCPGPLRMIPQPATNGSPVSRTPLPLRSSNLKP